MEDVEMVNGHVHLQCKCVPKIVNCFERRKGGVGTGRGRGK